MSNPGNIVGGHKANLNNPSMSNRAPTGSQNHLTFVSDTSEESKQHSKDVLDNEFAGGNVEKSDGKNPQNVAGGLKATVNNPQVSQEAKDSAQERLKDMGQ
ncbi:MAG: hypothetical protein LQ348_002703 [Seirophora lacunosa]|nr:MAG: hypothetical protein LQ344_007870 [Seirophora lacunosa]KAI4194113.1 MAG: hypothetical protein LQ348_002703 [Seirophora lacunosa]